MRDRDIRSNLRRELERAHRIYASETLLIDELGLCQGHARVDVAVVNGSLSGYEIKSEKDTLQRLPHQVEIYSRALDFVTVVASDAHVEKTMTLVPDWWGLIGAFYADDGDIAFRIVREAEPNPALDAFSVAQLLWRSEALLALKDLGVEKGMTTKPRRALWQILAESQSLDDLRQCVRNALKVRVGWRSDPLQMSGDGLFLCDAT
jgi:hypothetical protein